MTEENATEKQIEFMKKLGVSFTIPISKEAARELIRAKIEERDKVKNGVVKPEIVTPGYPKAIEARKDGNGKEFHLTEEAIRSNALRCAVEICKMNGKSPGNDEFKALVKTNEEYIRHGN